MAGSLVIACGYGAPLDVSCKSARLSPLSPCQHRPRTKHYLVTSWSALHWIDVLARHFRAPVTYSYIFVGCFFNSVRAFSDVFVLWGTWRVLIRYKHLRPNMEETPGFGAATAIAGLLWFLAFYHICLLFALSFAWLSFSDLDAINSIAEARNGFEIAFTAIQFISTIWTAIWAWDIVVSHRMTNPYQKVRSHTLEIYIQDGSNAMSNIRHRKYGSRS